MNLFAEGIKGMVGGFGGIRVFEVPTMVGQVRWPRSKRKRIQAKWRKNPRNFGPAKHFIQNRRGDIYCHPVMAAELRRSIQPIGVLR